MPDGSRLRRRVGRALLWSLALTLSQPIGARQPKQQRVLALYLTTPGAAGATAFENVYQQFFAKALGNRVDFYSEFIDLARFSEPAYQRALVEFLRYKYQRLPPDVIIATTEGARQFVERSRAALFPDIPVVFIDRTTAERPDASMTGISAPLDLAGTLDLALTLQPRTRQVVVVGGVSQFDRFYQRLARDQLQRFADRVTLTFLFDKSMADLEQAVVRLPPDAIVYWLTLGEDAAGARFRSVDALRQLSAAARVPIYGWNAVAMGNGIVGGRLYTNEIVAERSARLALRILNGEAAASIPVVEVDPTLTQVDWRQLRRYGISEARLPSGTTTLFREPSLLDQYKVYLAGGVALLCLQTALIAGLLLQRARRRRVEAALLENQATLQASNQQISELFGRLITVQETERARIARDLHDDLSQRVAGLSIMLSGLKRKLRGEADDVRLGLTTIHQSTMDLAEGIRVISHDLHPSVLQHASLDAALRALCAQFQSTQGITVGFTAAPEIGQLEAECALCLYRITQEALHNVVKHAAARHVTVVLSRTSAGVELSVTDDGMGFDLAGMRARRSGLGLVSIDERARLLRGTVHIASSPGGGTRMRVRIPAPPLPPGVSVVG